MKKMSSTPINHTNQIKKRKKSMTENLKRAVGIFGDPQIVEDALNELKASGFDMARVSVIAKQIDKDTQFADAQVSGHVGNQEVKGTTGIVKDTAMSGVIATFLVGLSSLVLPSIGPVIAAGTAGLALVATVVSSGVEAASIGNLVKALVDTGIPEEDAKIYSDRLIAGDPLIIVEGIPEDLELAAGILEKRKIQNWAVYPSKNLSQTT
jgi:hypothetical protein